MSIVCVSRPSCSLIFFVVSLNLIFLFSFLCRLENAGPDPDDPRMYDIKPRYRFQKHQASILAVMFSSDGQYLGTCDHQYSWMYWDLQSGKRVMEEKVVANIKWLRWTCPVGWPVQGTTKPHQLLTFSALLVGIRATIMLGDRSCHQRRPNPLTGVCGDTMWRHGKQFHVDNSSSQGLYLSAATGRSNSDQDAVLGSTVCISSNDMKTIAVGDSVARLKLLRFPAPSMEVQEPEHVLANFKFCCDV